MGARGCACFVRRSGGGCCRGRLPSHFEICYGTAWLVPEGGKDGLQILIFIAVWCALPYHGTTDQSRLACDCSELGLNTTLVIYENSFFTHCLWACRAGVNSLVKYRLYSRCPSCRLTVML
ncbi:unnamed protein product [Pylaiella littoralis]